MPENEIAVSVIIPVHNARRSLPRALRLLLGQSLLARAGMEVIVVDDGSTDRTHEIALQAAKDNPEIVRLHRQRYAGPAIARGTGLRLARGKYVGFTEPGGRAEPELFGALYDACEAYQADIAGCAAQAGEYGREAVRQELLPRAMSGAPEDLQLEGKLFRRAFLEENHFTLPENGVFTARCLAQCERFAAVPGPLYRCAARPGSSPDGARFGAYDAERQLRRELGLDTEGDLRRFCSQWVGALRGYCAQDRRGVKTSRAFYERVITLAALPQAEEILAHVDRETLPRGLRAFYDAFAARDWAALEKRLRWRSLLGL